MEVIQNIKKYGNKDKDYVPHEYATCYPLHSQDFVRTGFQDISYTLASRDYKDPKCVIETVRIKQATKQGYIECEVGGVADLSFPDSETRRGRVQENGRVSPTIMSGEQDICRIETYSPYVNQKYKEFQEKNGYIPEYFNPYNKTELTDIAPTLTAQG